MKYRSRLQITVEILQIAAKGANKTHIMYGATLSFKQMNEYMPHLIGKGLLEYDETGRTYTTTAKGQQVLMQYQKLEL